MISLMHTIEIPTSLFLVTIHLNVIPQMHFSRTPALMIIMVQRLLSKINFFGSCFFYQSVKNDNLHKLADRLPRHLP